MAMLAMILGSARRTERANSNCTVACQIKFATCTLQGNALTWWNSHVKTVSHEVAYGMTWKTLKKMMTDKVALLCGENVSENPDEVESTRKDSRHVSGKCDRHPQAKNMRTEKKEYVGTPPLCNKCKFHHNGPCTELKSRNQGNQAGGTDARGIVYALGEGETDQDLDNMEDDFIAYDSVSYGFIVVYSLKFPLY
ncbi:hypothetical protein Tco_0830568 [Tanacetum coccineum]